jgi:hypothetical protein
LDQRLLAATMTDLPLIPLETLAAYATLKNFVYISGGIVLIKLAELAYWPVRKSFSPLRHLAGPPNESFIFGNLKRIFAAQSSVIHEEWVEKYGPTFAYRGFLLVCNPYASRNML